MWHGGCSRARAGERSKPATSTRTSPMNAMQSQRQAQHARRDSGVFLKSEGFGIEQPAERPVGREDREEQSGVFAIPRCDADEERALVDALVANDPTAW